VVNRLADQQERTPLLRRTLAQQIDRELQRIQRSRAAIA
jgi:hypothetical protein